VNIHPCIILLGWCITGPPAGLVIKAYNGLAGRAASSGNTALIATFSRPEFVTTHLLKTSNFIFLNNRSLQTAVIFGML